MGKNDNGQEKKRHALDQETTKISNNQGRKIDIVRQSWLGKRGFPSNLVGKLPAIRLVRQPRSQTRNSPSQSARPFPNMPQILLKKFVNKLNSFARHETALPTLLHFKNN